MTISSVLGENIRKRRKALKMTQAELAVALGMPGSQSYVSGVENGEGITTETLDRFAKALRTSRAALLGEFPDTTPDPPIAEMKALGWPQGEIDATQDRWPFLAETEKVELVMAIHDLYEGQQELERRNQRQRDILVAVLHRRKPPS